MIKKTLYQFIWLVPLLVLFIYSYLLEPIWIEVSRHSIKSGSRLTKPLKIAHVSDLHIRSIGYREEKILSILEKEKPDVVLVTGDSISESANYHAMGLFFEKIHAPLGVWLVKGNWEHWRPSTEESSIYRSIRLLDNSASQLTEDIWIIGVDDEPSGFPDLNKALKNTPSNAFKIGLFHSPAFFDKSFASFDLVLTGHTHGGQIRLPFLPPLWLPEGSGNYISGWYKKGNSKMYVSRGLGNSILDVRFLCRPELSIIEVF